MKRLCTQVCACPVVVITHTIVCHSASVSMLAIIVYANALLYKALCVHPLPIGSMHKKWVQLTPRA